MKLIYFKPALKCDSFDIAIGIKIPFFRVLVTIEPGRSLLQFVTTNCLIYPYVCFLGDLNANYSTETIFRHTLKAVIAENGLVCCDEVALELSTFTYLSPSGHTSWIDHVVCSSSFITTVMPIPVRRDAFGSDLSLFCLNYLVLFVLWIRCAQIRNPLVRLLWTGSVRVHLSLWPMVWRLRGVSLLFTIVLSLTVLILLTLMG